MDFHHGTTAIISRETKTDSCSHALIARRTATTSLCTFPLHRLSEVEAFHNHQAIVRHPPQFQLAADKIFRGGIGRPPALNVALFRQRHVNQRGFYVKTESMCDVPVPARRHAVRQAVRVPIPAVVPPASWQGQDVCFLGRIPRVADVEAVSAHLGPIQPPGNRIPRYPCIRNFIS